MNPKHIRAHTTGSEAGTRTAADFKELYDRFPGLDRAALKQIPVLPENMPLHQGSTYLDLRADAPQEFTAMGGEKATPDHLYVDKQDVPYEIWNYLIGEEKPEQAFEGHPSRRVG